MRLGWGVLGNMAGNWPHLWTKCCSCRLHRCGTEQIAEADQVVGDHMQVKHRSYLLGAAQFKLAQYAPLFDPSKHLLDAPAGIDRICVSLVAVGAPVNGGDAEASGFLGNMRRDADTVHLGYKTLFSKLLMNLGGVLI